MLPRVIAIILVSIVSKQCMGIEPYCGAYSVYAVQSIYGKDVDFESLLVPSVVEGRSGSSVDGIKNAAKIAGLHSFFRARNSVWDLQLADCPAILHFRSEVGLPDFNHWVVYLGKTDGKAKILDPSRGDQMMDWAEVNSLWDGAAVYLSDSQTELVSLRIASVLLRIVPVIVAFFVVNSIYRWMIVQAWSSWKRAFALIGFTITLGFLGDAMLFFGPTASAIAASNSAGAFSNQRYQDITYDELKNLDKSQVNLVDARFSEDFAAGTIETSISFPVDADSSKGKMILSSLSSSKPTIIFCQSSSCPYSDKIARRFTGAGFNDVRIYRGGYVEWSRLPSLTFQALE